MQAHSKASEGQEMSNLGTVHEPSAMLLKIHLYAASVKWMPSQLAYEDGSLHTLALELHNADEL